jgi:predicted dehydrogenase
MVKAADASGLVAACGFSYRRSPAVSAIGEQIQTGALGEIQHFSGRYWCDYSADPDAPTNWRYEGPRGSGALADLGSHLLDLSEQLCGPIVKIDGAALPILIKDRPVPIGAALGHASGGAVSDERRPVTNEDIATFVAEFANGPLARSPSPVSRSAIPTGWVSRSSAPKLPHSSTFLQTPSPGTSTTHRTLYQWLAAGDRRAGSPVSCSRSIHALFGHRPRWTRVLYIPGACVPG